MADDATANAPTQTFLDVESAANELVSALENLRAEAENYSEATARLDEAGGALITAAHAVKGLSEQIDAATRLMDGHATRVDGAVQSIAALRADLDAGLLAQAEAMKSLRTGIEDARRGMSEDAASIIVEHESRMDEVEKSLKDVSSQIEDKLLSTVEASNQQLKHQLEENSQSMADATSDLKTDVEAAVALLDGKLQGQDGTLTRLSSRVLLAVMLAGASVLVSAGALVAALVR